jgi:1,4-dihydroxy-2-naphthoate octaprenyltransferase
MDIARHRSGPLGVVAAYATQVHPVFMLPPVAASLFGAVVAVRDGAAPLTGPGGSFAAWPAVLHAVAVFCAVYTAHVKDGYVDFHLRGEDDDHPLTAPGCRLGLASATVAFAACTAALGLLVGPWAALLTAPMWAIGYLHAPQLDTNPVTATTGYPLGVALALAGGYYVQSASLSATALAFCAVFLLLLSGVKVIDDSQDYEYDRTIAKTTVAVAVGRRRARRGAYALMAGALVTVAGFAAAGLFPPSAVAAVVAFAAVAAVAYRATDEVATMLLVRGAYVFLACLVAAVWFRPLS